MTAGTALTDFERGIGLVAGIDTDAAPLRIPRGEHTSARAALEAIVLEGLTRPPCGVSFSGGRDSSLVLAVATSVAGRHGLPAPVPITLRFPDVESSHESEWQEAVVTHLGLPDWERIEIHDELDLIGPTAADVLRRHGPQWPFNAYFHVPIFGAVRGGSLLTGVGGDEMLSADWTWARENAVLRRARRPTVRDPVRIAVSCAPVPVRRAFLTRRSHTRGDVEPVGWLTEDAFARLVEALMQEQVWESVSFSDSVRRRYARQRSRTVGLANLDRLAREQDVHVLSPLADDRFLRAAGAERGWRMFGSRTEATRWIAGDVLPADLVARRTKAFFDGAFFNAYSRDFVATWDGGGLDRRFVRPEVLRTLWTGATAMPDARTFPLVQNAWLGSTSVEPGHQLRDDLLP